MAGKLVPQPAKEEAPVRFKNIAELFDDMKEMYSSIARRAFELFEGKGQIFGHDLEDWFRAESELLHPVHITIKESQDGLMVEAEVPGFTTKDLEVSLEPRRLTITGQREAAGEHQEGKTIYQEHRANRILRVIELPSEIDPEKAIATLKHGILSFELPKAVAAKKVHIEPKAA